jgi:hypothetical protein
MAAEEPPGAKGPPRFLMHESFVGPKSTGGKASDTQTPANAHLGQDKLGLSDAQGAVGKPFTRDLGQASSSWLLVSCRVV